MKRSDVINSFLEFFEMPTYLEIGVSKGETFRRVRAARKVAVDPVFRFDVDVWRDEAPHCEFHQITSDLYFEAVADRNDRFDLIYLDGLHTSSQTLRDLINAFSFVKETSIIIVDDIWPSSFAASIADYEIFNRVRRAEKRKEMSWMGDVYRLVPFIEAFCPQWTYRCTAENHGQLVMWRHRRAIGASLSLEAVARFAYEDAVMAKPSFQFESLDRIVEQYKKDMEMVKAKTCIDGKAIQAPV